MYINDLLEAWANTLPVPFPVHVPQVSEEKQLQNESVHVVSYKSVPGQEDTPNPQEEIGAAGNLPFLHFHFGSKTAQVSIIPRNLAIRNYLSGSDCYESVALREHLK